MNVYVVLEHRFQRSPDGEIWTGGNLTYGFWSRYLSVFDQVTVVGRTEDVDGVPEGWKPVSGPALRFHPLPNYQGPEEMITKIPAIRRSLSTVSPEGDAVILRLPGFVSTLFRRFTMASDYPFGAEVVGDPWDAYSPGANTHPLRPVIRWSASRRLRAWCKDASAVSYVSSGALQDRYQAAEGVFTTHYSSIELQHHHFISQPKQFHSSELERPRLIFVGSFAQTYKGADVLLDAFAKVLSTFPAATLTLLGDGVYRPRFESYADQVGVSGSVEFLGHLPAGDRVREQLDKSTLFVMPSRTEGLPRAMIEAMARGLPSIGTPVGGIPELLPPQDMVERDDPDGLARKIVEVLSSPQRLTDMSARNLEKSMEYGSEILKLRRDRFYQEVKDRTTDWLNSSR